MGHALTAESLIQDLKKMPASERQKFFLIISESAFGNEDMTHAQLFGHLAEEQFTAQEAAEYLEISLPTLRRYVASGKVVSSSTVGRSQLYAASALKELKKALKLARGQ